MSQASKNKNDSKMVYKRHKDYVLMPFLDYIESLPYAVETTNVPR